jgi:hypothetical protein
MAIYEKGSHSQFRGTTFMMCASVAWVVASIFIIVRIVDGS